MKTWTPKAGEVERKWFVIDAKGKVLGRVAAETARILRGKHKPQFAAHMDTGDFVIVVNAEKIRLTGNKWVQKEYHHHTGYIGGLKTATAREVLEKRPEELIRRAVKGMLPKNKLGSRLFRKLKVYAGSGHPHQAQNPKPLNI